MSPDTFFIYNFSHPSIRGMLLAFSNISANGGVFTMYLLGSITTWRNVAIICLIFPISTAIAICFVCYRYF